MQNRFPSEWVGLRKTARRAIRYAASNHIRPDERQFFKRQAEEMIQTLWDVGAYEVSEALQSEMKSRGIVPYEPEDETEFGEPDVSGGYPSGFLFNGKPLCSYNNPKDGDFDGSPLEI